MQLSAHVIFCLIIFIFKIIDTETEPFYTYAVTINIFSNTILIRADAAIFKI